MSGPRGAEAAGGTAADEAKPAGVAEPAEVPGLATDASVPTTADGAGDARPDPEFPSELEIRWRQTRNAPPPVVRAVLANVGIAAAAGVLLLLYDWLGPSGGEGVAAVLYVTVVIISGTILTYLWVELPTGASGERRRSPWAGVLGFFASIPIVYLSLVVIFQILRPLLP